MARNNVSLLSMVGSAYLSDVERETNDFYATDPNSLIIFLDALRRDNIKLHKNIWECACGTGALSKILIEKGYDVLSTDIIDRGYGIVNKNTDFLNGEYYTNTKFNGDILTNPPYKFSKEFVEKALEKVENGNYVIMYLKIQFLESKSRKEFLLTNPPKYIYVNSERQQCYINGDMNNKFSSACCYCWFIWEKGFTGDPVIKWV